MGSKIGTISPEMPRNWTPGQGYPIRNERDGLYTRPLNNIDTIMYKKHRVYPWGSTFVCFLGIGKSLGKEQEFGALLGAIVRRKPLLGQLKGEFYGKTDAFIKVRHLPGQGHVIFLDFGLIAVVIVPVFMVEVTAYLFFDNAFYKAAYLLGNLAVLCLRNPIPLAQSVSLRAFKVKSWCVI